MTIRAMKLDRNAGSDHENARFLSHLWLQKYQNPNQKTISQQAFYQRHPQNASLQKLAILMMTMLERL